MAGGEREMMSFETLTLVPIDRRLVVPEMLSPAELDWLNAYHARVREIIGPELGPADRALAGAGDGGDPHARCHPRDRAAGVRASGASLELYPTIIEFGPLDRHGRACPDHPAIGTLGRASGRNLGDKLRG